jgi:hypothetical protein
MGLRPRWTSALRIDLTVITRGSALQNASALSTFSSDPGLKGHHGFSPRGVVGTFGNGSGPSAGAALAGGFGSGAGTGAALTVGAGRGGSRGTSGGFDRRATEYAIPPAVAAATRAATSHTTLEDDRALLAGGTGALTQP